jgi:hypothetical protein
LYLMKEIVELYSGIKAESGSGNIPIYPLNKKQFIMEEVKVKIIDVTDGPSVTIDGEWEVDGGSGQPKTGKEVHIAGLDFEGPPLVEILRTVLIGKTVELRDIEVDKSSNPVNVSAKIVLNKKNLSYFLPDKALAAVYP